MRHHLPSVVRRIGKRALNATLGWLAIAFLRLVRLSDPERAADVAGWCMRKVGPWLPEQRLGRANLAAAFPEKPPDEIERILSGVWDNLGRLAAEFAHLDRLLEHDPSKPGEQRMIVPAESAARFRQIRDDGKPALIFAAHLANWELPALAAAMHGIETAVLYRRPSIADVDRVVRSVRSVNMGELIPTRLDAPVKMAEALERGLHVGMLADQYTVQGVDVMFFGRRTKANPLIAKLARHIDCPIHGVRVIRHPNHRFTGEITEAIEPVRGADGQVDVAATTQVITSVIESWVREHPDQWLWLHRRWR